MRFWGDESSSSTHTTLAHLPFQPKGVTRQLPTQRKTQNKIPVTNSNGKKKGTERMFFSQRK
eukprot:256940-Amphidinium_carterae.1